MSRGRGERRRCRAAPGATREHRELVLMSGGREEGRRDSGDSRRDRAAPGAPREHTELVQVSRGRGRTRGAGEEQERQGCLRSSGEPAELDAGEQGQQGEGRRDRQLPQEHLGAHRAGTSEQGQGAGKEGHEGGQERQGCPRSSGEQAEFVRVSRGLGVQEEQRRAVGAGGEQEAQGKSTRGRGRAGG